MENWKVLVDQALNSAEAGASKDVELILYALYKNERSYMTADTYRLLAAEYGVEAIV